MRNRVPFHIVVALSLVLAIAQCAKPPKDQNSHRPKIEVSVETGNKDQNREGNTDLEDISRMKADRAKKESPPGGILERIKEILLKLKIPF